MLSSSNKPVSLLPPKTLPRKRCFTFDPMCPENAMRSPLSDLAKRERVFSSLSHSRSEESGLCASFFASCAQPSKGALRPRRHSGRKADHYSCRHREENENRPLVVVNSKMTRHESPLASFLPPQTHPDSHVKHHPCSLAGKARFILEAIPSEGLLHPLSSQPPKRVPCSLSGFVSVNLFWAFLGKEVGYATDRFPPQSKEERKLAEDKKEAEMVELPGIKTEIALTFLQIGRNSIGFPEGMGRMVAL
ncbi:NADH-quinone oxidoreductase subunit D, partial [Striga asiatica]